MSRALLLAVAIALVSPAAWALDEPTSSPFDNRIQYVNYNDGDVVLVRAVAGLGLRIVLHPGERIVGVASGFSQGWEFNDKGHILYLKPKSIGGGDSGQEAMSPEPGKWDTNVMVTTDQRMYDFDLRLLRGDNSGAPPKGQPVAYRVQFRYPAEVKQQEAVQASKEAARARLDALPPPVNWDYSMQIGDAAEGIAPSMAYDDGRFTYLRFPNNREFPTAFLVASDGSESIVNSHIDPRVPDMLVLHRVSPALVLRLGSAVVGIYNDSFDADGVPSRTGTTVPNVRRVLKAVGSSNNE
jgi:type IV secretion system protein VirB9